MVSIRCCCCFIYGGNSSSSSASQHHVACLPLATYQPTNHPSTNRPTDLSTQHHHPRLPYIHPLYISILLTLCKPTERTNVHECATFIHHPPNTLYQANYTGSTTTTGALLYIFYCVCTTACATDRTKFILPNDSDVSPGQYIINSSDPIRSMHGW